MRKVLVAAALLVSLLVVVPSAQAGHGTNLPPGGVNTHLTYTTTAYADVELVAQAIKAGEAKWYRDAINPDQDQAYYDRFVAAVRRIHDVSAARLDALFVRADQTATQIDQLLDQLAPLINEGKVGAVEGSNEWDNVNGSTAGWEVQVRTHQCELHKQVKARWPSLTVIGPSFTHKVGDYVGDLSHCMDVGNFHYYARHTGIDTRDLAERWRHAGTVAGWADGSGDPMIATEANGIYGCESPYAGSTEESQRIGMDDLYRLLGQQAYGGSHRVFAYELLNGSRPSLAACHSENNYGMYKLGADGRWYAKPVFYPWRDANRRG